MALNLWLQDNKKWTMHKFQENKEYKIISRIQIDTVFFVFCSVLNPNEVLFFCLFYCEVLVIALLFLLLFMFFFPLGERLNFALFEHC